MKLHNSPQPKDYFVTLEASLTSSPPSEEVAASFAKTMTAVTNAVPKRILPVPHHEELITSPYFMQLKTKLSLLAGSLVVLLLVGYTTVSRQGPYQGLEEVLLEDEAAYEFAPVEDSFDDLDEEYREDPTIEVESPASAATVPSGPTPVSEPVVTQPVSGSDVVVDVSADLAAIENLFADDDIDDSSLQDWYGDVSAADDVTSQTYDF